METQSILIVGNVTRDTIYFTSKLPGDDEVIEVDSKVICFGGRGVVPALVLAALGLQPRICTVVGADTRPYLEPFLLDHSVGTNMIEWDSAGSGMTEYVAFACPDEGTTEAVASPARVDWRPTNRQRDAVSSEPFVYFSTNPPTYNYELLGHVDPLKQNIIHNMGVRFYQMPEYVQRMLESSTILIGNHKELANLHQYIDADPLDLVKQYHLQRIIVTSGVGTISVFDRSSQSPTTFDVPRPEKPAVPIGAGDAFAAGILKGLVLGNDLGSTLDLAFSLGAAAARSNASYPDLNAIAGMGG